MNVKDFINNHNSFIIFGAGGGGIRLKQVLDDMGKEVACFLDNDNGRAGTLIDEIPVRHPGEFKTIENKVLIASVYFMEIAKQLHDSFGLNSGVEMMPVFDVILLLNDDMADCGGDVFAEFYNQNEEKFKQVENWLEDEESKKTYRKLVKFRKKMFTPEKMNTDDVPFSFEKYQSMMKEAAGHVGEFKTLTSEEYRLFYAKEMIFDSYQYKDIVMPKEGDVILDGGFWSGDTAHWFLSKTNEHCRIFGFEPEKRMIVSAANLLEKYSHIKVVNKGLYHKDGKLYFNYFENADNDSFVSENSGDKKIDVCRIDTFMENNRLDRLDFIKLDVEGSENQALEGGRESIRKYQPDLAICIYHKGSDFVDIPFLIKSINPEYRLFLSHKDITPWETVLFATIRGQ